MTRGWTIAIISLVAVAALAFARVNEEGAAPIREGTEPGAVRAQEGEEAGAVQEREGEEAGAVHAQEGEDGEADSGQEGEGEEDGAPPPAPPPPEQPIDFPHDLHVVKYKIDCQYCHFSAERSVDAGMPPVSLCMGCHSVIAGTENPEEIDKLRGYAERNEPIPWVRIYKVADHVHFPHMRHIKAGVSCETCHGKVEEMGVVEGLNQELSMGWCVGCHVERDAARDCTVCHY